MNQPREDAGNEWDTTAYDEDHSIVFEYGEGVVDLLEPETGERILDLGCGTGHLTDQIADSGADAVGLDASEEMIREARKIHPECEFLHADARNVSFSEPFDAVFSNAALHWISEQDAVLDGVMDALGPGSRFVAELGGTGNVAAIVSAVQAAAAERGYVVGGTSRASVSIPRNSKSTASRCATRPFSTVRPSSTAVQTVSRCGSGCSATASCPRFQTRNGRPRSQLSRTADYRRLRVVAVQ